MIQKNEKWAIKIFGAATGLNEFSGEPVQAEDCDLGADACDMQKAAWRMLIRSCRPLTVRRTILFRDFAMAI
jgi:hypothetical protein